MIKNYSLIIALTFSILLVKPGNADDHYEELPNVSNVQVNVCKLKELSLIHI